MTTTNMQNFCFTCGKANGRVRCEGCSKRFCLNDFNVHRQQLGTQLDEIEVARDLFRQTLTEKVSDSQNYILIEQINDWEKDSINQIRQAAQEARDILIKHTNELNAQLEEKLNMLTNQIRQSREENDYFEPNLNQWREELAQMRNHLLIPSNVSIRHVSVPLVTKITVEISDTIAGKDFGKSAQVTTTCSLCRQACEIGERNIHYKNCPQNPDNNRKKKFPCYNEASIQNSDRLYDINQLDDTANIPCEICDEGFTSKRALSEHLIICRNKTEQCPNCRKYVRRVVFAYHYVNNCANPDDASIDDDIRQTTQTVKPMVSVKCEYCEQNYQKKDRKKHRATCRENPANHSKNQQLSTDRNVNRNSDRSRPSDDSDDYVRIPCEWCNEEVPFDIYEKHAIACRDKEHKRLEELDRHNRESTPTSPIIRSTISSTVRPYTFVAALPAPSYASCAFCGFRTPLHSHSYHQLVCKMNPHRKGTH